MDATAWVVLIGTVLFAATAAYLFIRPPASFCRKFGWHDYDEATRREKDGRWQQKCKVKGCNSVLVLKNRQWTEIGE